MAQNLEILRAFGAPGAQNHEFLHVFGAPVTRIPIFKICHLHGPAKKHFFAFQRMLSR